MIEELKSSVDPDGYWMDGKYYAGVVCHIGHILEEWFTGLEKAHYTSIDCVEDVDEDTEVDNELEKLPASGFEAYLKSDAPTMPQCPLCFEYALNMAGGCENCTACTYSKCG